MKNLNEEYAKWCEEYDKFQGNHRFKAELLAYNAFKAGFKIGSQPSNKEVTTDACKCDPAQVGYKKAFNITTCSGCGKQRR